jgi:hypothetical protein
VLDCRADSRGGLLARGDVARSRDRVPAVLVKLGRKLLERFGAAADKRDRISVSCKSERGCPADPGCRSCYDRAACCGFHGA